MPILNVTFYIWEEQPIGLMWVLDAILSLTAWLHFNIEH